MTLNQRKIMRKINAGLRLLASIDSLKTPGARQRAYREALSFLSSAGSLASRTPDLGRLSAFGPFAQVVARNVAGTNTNPVR